MNNNELPVTGERVIEEEYKKTEAGYAIYLMHQASYTLAEKWTQGRSVLDYGCGSGYGAAKLADLASSVSAVDISDEAISYARQKYIKPNLNFECIKPNLALPYPDNHFDVVTSFQVIEHVSDDHSYLMEAYRVLKPGGIFLVITPDRKHRLLKFQRPWNRWHVREYSQKSLGRLVNSAFDDSKKLSMGSRGRVLEIELKRYRTLKWLTLPFTLPIFPFTIRRFFLEGIASIQSFFLHRHETGGDFDPTVSPMTVEDVYFSENVEKSLNIVFICTK